MGSAGIVALDTFNVLALLEPQVLSAVTDMVPPEDPAVAVMEVVVELPVHPEGKLHVYDVAPDTGDML